MFTRTKHATRPRSSKKDGACSGTARPCGGGGVVVLLSPAGQPQCVRSGPPPPPPAALVPCARPSHHHARPPTPDQPPVCAAPRSPTCWVHTARGGFSPGERGAARFAALSGATSANGARAARRPRAGPAGPRTVIIEFIPRRLLRPRKVRGLGRPSTW